MLAAVLKKKRVSKKKKIAWRKHVDISDVDAFLEDQRLEERIGKPHSLFKDEELFVVDVKPSTERKPTSKEERRLRLRAPPKCFSALVPHTNVPDPITKRNRVRTREERKNELVKRKEDQMRLKGILKAKQKQAIQDRKVEADKKRALKEIIYKDVWDENKVESPESWIAANTVRHTREGRGKVIKPAPKDFREKKSVLPAVDIPHPGTSYNPSFEDHQDLLNKVVEKEQKIIKQEKHLNRVTRDMFRKVSEAVRDSSWIVEMSEGLPVKEVKVPGNKEVIKAEVDDGSDTEYKALNPPVENKKKTLQQRRKQKDQATQENARRLAKLEKKKISDIYKLRFINKDLDKQEKKTEFLQEKRKKAEERKTKEAKRLGPRKFEEPDIDFSMGEDLPGNLRSLKRSGNLLSDRFKSLQKRNILEPSARRSIKKAKIKRFTKAGHKDDWKKSVARATAKA